MSKKSLAAPDHQWQVTFQDDPNGSGWSASFEEVSLKQKKRQPLELSCAVVQSGQSIRITSLGNDFDANDFAAHWHKSSTAQVKDKIVGGCPSPDDPKDGPDWVALDRLADGRNQFIQFQLIGSGKHAHLQLRYPAPVIISGRHLPKELHTDETDDVLAIPTTEMIMRITISVT
jgi:hypothetical protein